MTARMTNRIAGRLGGAPNGGRGDAAGALRAKLPPARRLATLLAGLVVAAGGGAYLTFATEVPAGAETPVPSPVAPAAAAPAAAAPAAAPVAAVSRTAGSAAAGSAVAPAAVRGAALATASAAAPDTTAARPPRPDTVVIEREVFGYSGGGRRDPFRPLIVTTVLRPFLSELRVVAVAYDPSGANSVAILRDVTSKSQHRVRAGQLIGRMRVVRIQPKAVVFAVEELGFSRRETLTLQDSLPPRQP